MNTGNRRRRYSVVSLTVIGDKLASNTNGMRLVIMVGAPASGKSRVADDLVTRHKFERISRDQVRAELYGDETIQGDGREVGRLFYQRLTELCAAGHNIVVDNTACVRRQRLPVVDIALESGYEDIILVMMDTPLEECLKRNSKRQRQVPEEDISNLDNLLRNQHMPSSREGRRIYLAPARKPSHYLAHYA